MYKEKVKCRVLINMEKSPANTKIFETGTQIANHWATCFPDSFSNTASFGPNMANLSVVHDQHLVHGVQQLGVYGKP